MAKKKKAALEQIELEYIFRASPTILYQFFTTPSCLIRWYCDEVDIEGKKYTFSWDGYPEDAELLEDEENERLRFRWDDSKEESYFEVRMSKSPVTSETILEVTVSDIVSSVKKSLLRAIKLILANQRMSNPPSINVTI